MRERVEEEGAGVAGGETMLVVEVVIVFDVGAARETEAKMAAAIT